MRVSLSCSPNLEHAVQGDRLFSRRSSAVNPIRAEYLLSILANCYSQDLAFSEPPLKSISSRAFLDIG